MDLSLATLLKLARDTVQSPRDVARYLLRLNIPASVGWTALLLTAVLSSLLTHLSFGAVSRTDPAMEGFMLPSPISLAVMQFVVMAVTAQLMALIGRWRGGRGTLPEALILSAWMQFVLLCVQILQLVFTVLLPPVADILGVLGLILFLWLLTNFVAELHGFASLGRVFGGIILTFVAAVFVFSILLIPFVGIQG